MDAAFEGHQRRSTSLGWRLRHSLWMIPAFFGLGALGWVSFVYVAARTRRRSWIGIAAFFVIAGAIAAFMPETENNVSGGMLVFVWAAAIVTALLLNPSYHEWLARRDPSVATAPGPTASSHTASSHTASRHTASSHTGSGRTAPPTGSGPQDTRPGAGGSSAPGSTGPVFGASGRWEPPDQH